MKRFDQINMVPFIDIVLVLLAIVMTTASFVSKGLIDVDLPEAESAQAAPTDQEAKELAIDASNQLFFQGEKVALTELDEALADYSKQTHFHLRVDKKAQFESFIAVVDALKKRELNQIAIETVEQL